MKRLFLIASVLGIAVLPAPEQTFAMNRNRNNEQITLDNFFQKDPRGELEPPETNEHMMERIRREVQCQYAREQAVKNFLKSSAEKAAVVLKYLGKGLGIATKATAGLAALLLTATTEAVSRIASLTGSLLFLLTAQKEEAKTALKGFVVKDSTTAYAWRALVKMIFRKES